jgi:hypothetical protein
VFASCVHRSRNSVVHLPPELDLAPPSGIFRNRGVHRFLVAIDVINV